jgi:hypothetical protein
MEMVMSVVVEVFGNKVWSRISVFRAVIPCIDHVTEPIWQAQSNMAGKFTSVIPVIAFRPIAMFVSRSEMA